MNVKSKRTYEIVQYAHMDFDDRPEPAKRLRKARIAAGFSSARAAAIRFGWSYDSYSQHERGERGIGRAAEHYAKAFKVSEGWLLTGEKAADHPPHRQVPLMGYIGAGGEVEAIDAGDLGTVEAPPEIAVGTIAAEVRGLSMTPAFEDGATIYWSQTLPPESLVNRRCVTKLADGRILVKILRPGSAAGLWRLESLNTAFPTMDDQVVEWVAKIDWVKPA